MQYVSHIGHAGTVEKHRGINKTADIWQTMFSDEFSWMKMISIKISLKFVLKGQIYEKSKYRQVSNIRGTILGNKIVDHPDVVGSAPVGAAPTTSSFSNNTWLQWIGQRQLQDETRHI